MKLKENGMNNYLLDTDILINHLRKYQKIEAVIEDLDLPQNPKLYHISVITKIEVLSGKSMSDAKIKKEAKLLLAQFKLLQINSSVTELAGQLRREHRLTIADAIIAATAISKDLILLSCNTKHFKIISDLRLI
ncbi:MAG: hypothetical protein UT11_C0010G0008 [Berkelbacteria bacterium GW2011_GWA2_38_9]|uniref:PIN domain-containing protein n=1 Tax=Berkelbacteria bacterium GW2011_GWA2_38_9 TaxID=1618334 RepID=A0A0G0PLR0_9BACT|nr:MAG: hypothetical protein UT11_C0010G0008 [Berkelbacteria bacterium GW2011_GWA2_38_9]